MTKTTIAFNREFHIWSFNIGHGELLLRSTKTSELTTRIDILFKDVRAIDLRTRILRIAIEEADTEELLEFPTKPQQMMEKGHKIFLIKSEGWTGCVIAGSVYWCEDQGEYGQPSKFAVGNPPRT